jgi:metallophosphoesterase (TIGR00282 family)|tara:strand:+ start:130 stop:936 length:807 start_codon:yes stop_codon:yes gene_type:complete
MNILFLGDIVGNSGCAAIKKFLPKIIKSKKVNFVAVNGENAAKDGVGITENIVNELLSCGIDVITTGNHVWDQKETYEFIKKQKRLLRPLNLFGDVPGEGFGIYDSIGGYKVGVLNLMGNVFMKKCEDVFVKSQKFINAYKLKKNYDFLIVDFHGEITSEKMAIGHVFDGNATFVVGTHTHVPTNDGRVLDKGTAYLTDAGMCGDYNSVIGMNTENSINRFYKRESKKHFPAEGEASLCGAIIEANPSNGLAKKITPFIFGGQLGKDK